jgi:hypothetical protein
LNEKRPNGLTVGAFCFGCMQLHVANGVRFQSLRLSARGCASWRMKRHVAVTPEHGWRCIAHAMQSLAG